MSNWYTTRIIKPVSIIYAQVNVPFSLKNDTGLPHYNNSVNGVGWKNPYFLYNYRSFETYKYDFNGNLELKKIDDDTYVYQSVSGDILEGSRIDVLVMESDETIPKKEFSLDSYDWVNYFKLSPSYDNIDFFILNTENEFMFDLRKLASKGGGKIKVMFWLKNMYYLDGLYKFDISIANTDTTNVYRAIVRQKGAGLTKQGATEFNNSFSTSVSDVYSCVATADTALNKSTFSLYVDGEYVGTSERIFENLNTSPYEYMDIFGASGLGEIGKTTKIEVRLNENSIFTSYGTISCLVKDDRYYDITSGYNNCELVCLAVRESWS